MSEQKRFTLDDLFLPAVTGTPAPDYVREAFHTPDMLSAQEIGQRDQAAEAMGTSYGEADAGWEDMSTEMKIRRAESVPNAEKWVADSAENAAFLDADGEALMAVYEDLIAKGLISENDMDSGTVGEIAQAGPSALEYTFERGRLTNERMAVGLAYRDGRMTADKARAEISRIDSRLSLLAKRRGDPLGFYSFVEQGYRMLSQDLPMVARRAAEGALYGASAAALAGSVAPVVGNIAGAGVGAVAGFGAGAARGMFESSQSMEEANFLADMLTQKDDAGQYLDETYIREAAALYGSGSALVEFGGDLASLAAARFISPAVKTVMANMGLRSPALFAKDAIRTAVANKQAWPVIRRFLLGMAAGAAAEGAEEAVQEGVSAQVEASMKNWLADAGVNYFREEQDGLLSSETWAQMAEAGLEGAKVGAWFVLFPGLAQLAVDSVRVSRAREFAQAAKDVSDTIAATKTKELSPSRMETFLQAQGLNQTVFLPADAAWQMQQSGVELAAPLGWEQTTLEEAAALGHDIPISFARLEARLEPGVMKQVADIIKEGPDSPNALQAQEPNLFLANDIEAIDAAVQEWEFEQNLLDFELERLRSDLTEAVRSVPNLLKDIVASADTETSVGTYVDSIVRLVEKAAQRLRVYGDDVDTIIRKLRIQGLERDMQGRVRTAEEIERMVTEAAEAQADAPFWDNVWGRLDADSLMRDFPEARKELARQHGRGLFAKRGEGIAVDELADILKNAGWLEQDADSSTLVEMLKSKKSPKRTRGQGWAENFLRLATHNIGTFDRRDSSILYQSYPELDDQRRAAVDAWLDEHPDGAEIREQLELYRGTPWEKQAVESILIRIAMVDYMAGRGLPFYSKLGAATKVLEYLSKGEEGLWQYLRDEGILGHAPKAGLEVNGSFINCSPSPDCARYCYAAKGNYARAIPAVKSEMVSLAVELDPKRAAALIAREYMGTLEFEAKKALRLFDKGDIHETWIPLVKDLNRRGIRTQVFSKRPHILRQLDASKNVLMLSIDRTNWEMADQNPDLPIAFVYSGREDLAFLERNRERFEKKGGSILPVIKGGKILPREEIESLPKWAHKYTCPIDSGMKTLYDDAKNPDGWKCTRCDKNGGFGCFYGRTALYSYKEIKNDELFLQAGKRDEARRRSNLDATDIYELLRAASVEERQRILDEMARIVDELRERSVDESEGRLLPTARRMDGRASLGDMGDSGSDAGAAGVDADTLEQRAWHGGPRDFDAFDFTYMGKGEGQQVHGWGGYVAARREISDKRYRERLAKGSKFIINGKRINGEDAAFLEQEAGGRALYEAEMSGDFTKLRQELRERIEYYRTDSFLDKLINLLQSQIDRIDANPKLSITKFLEGVPASDKYRFDTMVQFARFDAKEAGRRANIADVRARIVAHMEPFVRQKEAQLRTADRLESFDIDNLEVYKNEGQLFELEIPEEEEMLIEGKYFYEQSPAIQEAILKAFGIADDSNASELVKEVNANLAARLYELKGRDIYKALVSLVGSPKAASLALLKEGIQGISYTGGIDGQAWVIFDEKKIEIIQKYYAMLSREAQTYQTAEIQRLEDGDFLIRLFRGANLSSLAHEISHAVHMEMERIEREGKGTEALKRDLAVLRRWQSKYDDEAVLRAEYERYYKTLYGVEFDELDAVGKLAVKQRAQREMVARGFELYLREGESPSAGMEGVFRRFKKWLMRVYRKASMLDVELTDEVREVFSHLVASDEEIAAAAAKSSVHEESAAVLDALGVQGADRLELEGMIADAKDKAADALRRSRARYRRDHVQEWRDEVERELDADPVYRVRKALRRTPIDLDSVVETYGQDLADRLRVSLPASVKRGGDNPELLAFDYGFSNAGEMINAILNRPGTAERRKELLAQKRQDADARYAAEDYLFEQDELAQQQDKIGEIVYRLELEGRTQGGKPVAAQGRERWKAAREQIKTIAEQYLDGKRAGEAVRPDIYRTTAARLVREERAAILAKDWGTALQANYKARLNLEIARQAAERRDIVEKLTGKARRFLDSKTPDKGARFAVFALSQNIRLFEPTHRMVQNAAEKGMEDIHEFLEDMRDQGYYTVDAEIPDSLFTTAPGAWRGLTWAELRPYLEAMAVTMHMEQASRKANSEAAKAAWRFEMDTIAAHILSENKHRQPGPFAKKNAIIERLKELHASHLKADTICRLLDGDKDFGPVWSAIILPINRATADRDRRLRKAQAEVQKIFGMYTAREWVDIRSLRVFVQPLNASITKEQILAMALNCGNASNKQRLMTGLGLSEAQIQAVINELDERDVLFIQRVWDYLETFRKESFDLEESLTGVRPQAIEAQPLQTRFGELRGGYYPVVYDREQSSKPIDTESIGTLTGSMMPAVDHGSLKQRTATGLGAALQLDLEAIPRHVVRTVHMLAFRKPIQQVARVLNDKAVLSAIESTAGVAQAKALKSWLHYVAGERPGRNGWSRALGMLRKNASLYAMGMKLTTMLAQTTGLLAAVAEIGPRWVLSGIVRTYAGRNPFMVYRETAALSTVMENRIRSVDRDLYEMSTGLMTKGSSNKLLDPLVRFRGWQERNAYLPMGFIQMAFCDLPTWQGAYAKAIYEGMSQEKAVLYADAVVERTQVGGADKDLAGVQRGEEMGKILTQFYSYFSALYQLYARRLTMAKRRGSTGDTGRLATLFLLTGVLEPVLSAVATRNTPEEGEDDLEDWLAWAGQKIFFNPFNMVIGVRDISAAVESMLEGYGGRARAGSLLNDTIDAGTRFLQRIQKGTEMDAHKVFDSGWKLAGLLTGQVNAQELLIIDELWDWLDGTNPDFELADLIRQKKK